MNRLLPPSLIHPRVRQSRRRLLSQPRPPPGRLRAAKKRSTGKSSRRNTESSYSPIMQNLELRPIADFLDQLELILERRKIGIPSDVAFDQRQIQVRA